MISLNTLTPPPATGSASGSVLTTHRPTPNAPIVTANSKPTNWLSQTNGVASNAALIDSSVGNTSVAFDYRYHSLTDRSLGYRDGFDVTADTQDGVRPVVHYSESHSLRDGTARPQEHAEYVDDLPKWLHDRRMS